MLGKWIWQQGYWKQMMSGFGWPPEVDYLRFAVVLYSFVSTLLLLRCFSAELNWRDEADCLTLFPLAKVTVQLSFLSFRLATCRSLTFFPPVLWVYKLLLNPIASLTPWQSPAFFVWILLVIFPNLLKNWCDICLFPATMDVTSPPWLFRYHWEWNLWLVRNVLPTSILSSPDYFLLHHCSPSYFLLFVIYSDALLKPSGSCF